MQADAFLNASDAGALEPRSGHHPYSQIGKQVQRKQMAITTYTHMTLLLIAPFDLPKEKLKSGRKALTGCGAIFCYTMLGATAKIHQKSCCL